MKMPINEISRDLGCCGSQFVEGYVMLPPMEERAASRREIAKAT